MLAQTSFRDELVVSLKRFDAFPQEVKNHWKHHLALEVIGRWQQHPEAERIWKILRPAMNRPACEFIAVIIAKRIEAEELATRLDAIPALEAMATASAKYHLQNKTSEAQRQLAAELLLRADLRDSRALFSRKGATAPRNYFMGAWLQWFRQECGQPFHGVVATLTEIAFGKPVALEAVRDLDRGIRRAK